MADTKELTRLERDWGRINANDPNPAKSFEWTRACLATLNKSDIIHIIESTSGGAVDGIVVMTRRPGRLPRLVIAGSDDLHFTTDAIFRDDGAARRLAAAVRDTGKPVWLVEIPAKSPFVEAMREAYQERGWIKIKPCGSNPLLPLDSRWLEPERNLTSQTRHNVRRRRRIAEEMGKVSFEALAPTPAQFAPLWREAIGVEAAGWKGRAGTALAVDERQRSFFQHYAVSAAERGALRLLFLRIGGVAAAMQLAVVQGGELWLLKTGYNEDFKRAAPGALLFCETARYAASQSLKALQCLGDITHWLNKDLLTYIDTVTIHAYPSTPAGWTVLAANAAAAMWHRMRRLTGGAA
jgi:CelD/BcsL family acetyltransferase involved in cellulose biosynthesis